MAKRKPLFGVSNYTKRTPKKRPGKHTKRLNKRVPRRKPTGAKADKFMNYEIFISIYNLLTNKHELHATRGSQHTL